jgi:hypothetical protein
MVVQRGKQKSLKSLKGGIGISTSIPVVFPSGAEERSGVCQFCYSVEDGCLVKGESVRVLEKKEVQSLEVLKKAAGQEPGWVDFLIGIKKLQKFEKKGKFDDPIVEQAAYRLIAPKMGLNPASPPPEKFADTYLMPSLARAFTDVKLAFWHPFPKTRVFPALRCPDQKSAVAARWLLSSDVRVCTHCPNIFLAKRPKQTACSIACREAHRVARWHARKKKERAA